MLHTQNETLPIDQIIFRIGQLKLGGNILIDKCQVLSPVQQSVMQQCQCQCL